MRLSSPSRIAASTAGSPPQLLEQSRRSIVVRRSARWSTASPVAAEKEPAAAIEQIMAGEATPARSGAYLAGLRPRRRPRRSSPPRRPRKARNRRPRQGDVIDVVGARRRPRRHLRRLHRRGNRRRRRRGAHHQARQPRPPPRSAATPGVLEALGGKLEADGPAAAKVVDGAGFCFLLAHAPARHAPRRRPPPRNRDPRQM